MQATTEQIKGLILTLLIVTAFGIIGAVFEKIVGIHNGAFFWLLGYITAAIVSLVPDRRNS